jgi:T-complex protein 1 subunit alpha
MERALHDSLCVIKRTLESGSVVPGGGAVETALSIYLENFATTLVGLHRFSPSLCPPLFFLLPLRFVPSPTCRSERRAEPEDAIADLSPVFPALQGSREQLAIAEFAAALLVIPKTLSVNAGKDSTELVAKLRAYHNAAQSAAATDPKRGLRFYGLDLVKGEVRDNLKAGVLEPMVSKIKSFKSALEASTALLRIDDRVSFLFLCLHLFDSRLPFVFAQRASADLATSRLAQITVPPAPQQQDDGHGH